MAKKTAAAGHLARQRGMSLVELMVGVTIGLFIVAAASLLVGNQLTDNRRLLLETQLQQDMRATMDIMSRQIRRAGALQENQSQALVASDGGAAGLRNLTLTQIDEVASDELGISYSLNFADQNFGFKRQVLPSGIGVIKSFIGANAWRFGGANAWNDLTDPNAVNVTELRFDPISARESVVIPCPKLCPGGTRACWPTVEVRGYRITIAAQAVSDARVQRSLQSEVRVRNDFLKFNTGVPTQACPS